MNYTQTKETTNITKRQISRQKTRFGVKKELSGVVNFWLYNPPPPIYRSMNLFKQKIYPVIIPPPLECKSPPACIEIWIRLFTTFWSLKMWSNSKKYYGYICFCQNCYVTCFTTLFLAPDDPILRAMDIICALFFLIKRYHTLATSTSPCRPNCEVSTHYPTSPTRPWVSQNHMTLTSGICLDLILLGFVEK